MCLDSHESARRKRLSNCTRNNMLVVFVVIYTVSATHWALTTPITVRWSCVGNVFVPPSEELALIYLSAVNVRRSLLQRPTLMLIAMKFILNLQATPVRKLNFGASQVSNISGRFKFAPVPTRIGGNNL